MCGRWPIKVETKAGSGGQVPDATRVLVDPNLHAVPEDPGLVLHEAAGAGVRRLTVDTTLLANGPHKLVIAAKADENLDERLAGAQVIPFSVDNGPGCAPAPAVDPIFPAAATLSGSPLDSADLYLDAFADGASEIEYWVDGRLMAWDASAPDFDEYLDVDALGAGEHELVVKATIDGELHESAPETFTVAR